MMIRILSLCVTALMVAGSAQAATVGLTCDGRTQIVVAPTMAKANACIATMAGCTVGFNANGGYFAVAQTVDGLGQGAAGGYRSEKAVSERAISSCEALGAGSCVVILSGHDDGNSYRACQ